MDEFVPEDILKLIERIEAKKDADYRKRKLAKEAERERLGAIEALRQASEEDLLKACQRIDAWIENFNRTAGPSIWQLLGEKSSVTLFIGGFHRGEPTPLGDVTCCAHLKLGGPDVDFGHGLVYEEHFKGEVSSQRSLLAVRMLWLQVHPDFVMQCDAHLSGPDAWMYIRQCLEQMDR